MPAQPIGPETLLHPEALLAVVGSGIAGLPFGERKPHSLYKPLEYILSLPGKKLRPLLVLLSYQAFSQRPAASCLHTALAIELFHNFTLLHDDIMDNATTRRGKPTVHVKWNTNTAILSGDALFAYTHVLIAEEFPDKAAALIQLYTRIALEVCEGQMEDMELAAQPHASVTDYVAMIEKKTAALLGGALRMGALAAGATTDAQDALEQFGRAAGIGFQLQDDYLDAFGDQAKFGKKPGGDIIENKKTFLWLRAYEKASPSQQAEIDSWAASTGKEDAKVAAVLRLYHELAVDADTRAFTEEWFTKAEAILLPYQQNPGMQLISAFMDKLRVREY